MLINVFKIGIFAVKYVNIDDGYHAYDDDEFDRPKTPITLPVVTDAPLLARESSQGRGIRI